MKLLVGAQITKEKMKFIILLFIFLGEFIGIALEIILASKFRSSENFPEILKWLIFLIPFFVLSFVLLLIGYIYGYRYFQKIWIITIVSWSSIVLIEPILNYLIFKELPQGKIIFSGVLALAAIAISIF